METLSPQNEARRRGKVGIAIDDKSLCAMDLRNVEVLQGLDTDQLEWLCTIGELGVLEEGDLAFENGAPAEHMYFLLEGAVQFQLESDGNLLYAGALGAGEVGGLLPYSRMTHHTGQAVALARSRAVRIHKRHFPEMAKRTPELVQRLVGIMSDRVREATRTQQQREKMMALGKLSAGLAHELNNPASAIGSTTKTLLERLARMPERVIRLGRHDLSEEQLMSISGLPQILANQRNPQLKALERSRLEDEITDWLEDHGVRNGWTMAESFVDAGFEVSCLEDLAAETPPDALEDVLCWVEGHTAIYNLVQEVSSAAERISSLVNSIKSYSHMDRAPSKQFTDVHPGIDTTLTMLGHKLKRKNIQVVKRYGDDVPAVLVMPGEMNQVWTNLIDNAIDAMPAEGGCLEIETQRINLGIRVCISDNGSGIPDELQSRIFEPFFTTKPVGEGTGLGLDIVHRIVTRQHQGYIEVYSKPGRTTFEVTLPAGSDAAPAATPPNP